MTLVAKLWALNLTQYDQVMFVDSDGARANEQCARDRQTHPSLSADS